MKKIYLLSIIVLAVNATFAQNENKQEENKNVIKFNAIAIFEKVYDLQYERVINKRNSLEFGIGFGNYSSADLSEVQDLHSENFGRTINNPKDGFVTEKTFSITVGYRHYYMENNAAPRGLYLSPSIQYLKTDNSFGALEQDPFGNVDGTFNYVKREYQQEVNIVNVRALIGCQLIIANLVCVNPYFGPSYAFGTAKDYDGEKDTKATGVLLNFGIYVGVGF